MTKARLWLCSAALLLALATPAAWADDSGGALSWIEQIVAQVVAAFDDTDASAAAPSSDSGGTSELGELAPVGG